MKKVTLYFFNLKLSVEELSFHRQNYTDMKSELGRQDLLRSRQKLYGVASH